MIRIPFLVIAFTLLTLPHVTFAQTEPAIWDYVALGDSLAVGVGSVQGYVDRYAGSIEQDRGVDVRVMNVGELGATSGELLDTIQTNAGLREALASAEVVTWNIGRNDLSSARISYKRGTCGGSDNQDCLRAAEAAFITNWEAIVSEITTLTNPRTTVLRTMTIYNPFVGDDMVDGSFAVFQPYLDRINSSIATVAVTNGIAYGQVYRAFTGADGTDDPEANGYLWFDGLHPSTNGYSVMAESLRAIGYARSTEPANAAFERTWARTDEPVATGAASRTWMWGGTGYSAAMHEEYAESPGGQRLVQYFDKSRMEINDPAANPSASWYVSNGLLVVELMSGRMQVGGGTFVDRLPAEVNVAGDPGDQASPTYAMMGMLRARPPLTDGSPVIQRIAADGTVVDDASLARYDVTAAERVTADGIDHRVASVFWEFMHATGMVATDGVYQEQPLFVESILRDRAADHRGLLGQHHCRRGSQGRADSML